jgi:hypothetical protein
MLVTDGDTDTPERVRILDLSNGKLGPELNTQSVLARGYWEEPLWEGDVNVLIAEGQDVTTA